MQNFGRWIGRFDPMADALGQCNGQDRPSLYREKQKAIRPIGREASQEIHRRAANVICVQEHRVETARAHGHLHTPLSREDIGLREFLLTPRHEAVSHAALPVCVVPNSSRGVFVSTSAPPAPTMSESPSTM